MISAVILTKNNEDFIDKCLKSVSWCDEIVIIDDYSSDNTSKIAKKYKASVYKRKLKDDFAAQRNYGLNKAQYDWVLFVDSDEVVTKTLQNEIQDKIHNTKFKGFYIKRSDYWLGKHLRGGESGNNYIVRLGRRKSGKWTRKVHESWEIEGRFDKLSNNITHYPHPNMSSFIDHINFHSSLHAVENNNEHKKSTLLKILSYPLIKFFKNYIFKKGYLDSTHGFVAAMMMSFHSFLSWSELWILQKK